MQFLAFFIALIFWASPLASQDYISLEGYLGADQMQKATEDLDRLSQAQDVLVLKLKTSSGDLDQILNFARRIYHVRSQKGSKIIVYLDDMVIGPGAILPFLADELYSSLFVSWGDIQYGSENGLPSNILKNRLKSLILQTHPQAALLNVLAEGMSDKDVIVNSQGQLTPDEMEKDRASGKGEALIVNQVQLKNWGLLKVALNWDEFKKTFQIKDQKLPNPSQAASKIPYEKLKEHIRFNPQGENRIGWIVIDDRQSGISQATALYVKAALDYYKKNKPIFIVLELNTPGGEVYAAQKISDALKEMDTQLNVPIVAYINNWAISAGAMLAYSSRFITVVKDGSMGAAEPVLAQQTGEMKEASEKVNSALRADFANRASFFDRNPLLAEAMVDKDLILVMRHGKITKLDREDQIRKSGPEPDILISPKGKLLTLNSEQLLKYQVADVLVPPSKTEFLSSEKRKEGLWPAKSSQLFHAPFFDEIPNAVIDEYQMDWKTRFFAILAHPMVSSMLFLGLMLGLYMEISNPGLMLPGTVAVISLFFIVLSSFAQEIGNILEVILLFSGILMLLVEVFLLPSFGLIGIAGILFFFAGLFGLMLPGIGAIDFEVDTQTLNAAGEAFFERLAWLSLTILIGTFLIIILSRYLLPSFNLWNRFVLKGNEQDASEGYVAGLELKDMPSKGTKGEVLATLRPAGKVLINNQVFDAMSSGGYVEKGEKVTVVGVESSTLLVKVEDEEQI